MNVGLQFAVDDQVANGGRAARADVQIFAWDVAFLGAWACSGCDGGRWILGLSGWMRCDPMMFSPMVDDKKLEHNPKA
jgi:hypothetical protein